MVTIFCGAVFSDTRYLCASPPMCGDMDCCISQWVQILWNNVLNKLRITDQRGFPREEHLPESHREHGFIIPEGYKPLAGGEAARRHPRKTDGNGPTPEGVVAPSIKIPQGVFR
jgi:hypothetical protein